MNKKRLEYDDHDQTEPSIPQNYNNMPKKKLKGLNIEEGLQTITLD
jgi:hypothetical protein